MTPRHPGDQTTCSLEGIFRRSPLAEGCRVGAAWHCRAAAGGVCGDSREKRRPEGRNNAVHTRIQNAPANKQNLIYARRYNFTEASSLEQPRA